MDDIKTDKMEYIRLEARKELSRRYFYDYLTLKYPKHYTPERVYLKDIAEKMQSFIEQDEKKFLILNMPPRHRKSFTGTGFVEWVFGDDPSRKVISGSYNETLSTTFATKVRDTIAEQGESTKERILYSDIFPHTKIKYGEASKSYWALDGNTEKNYLATSPTGTATGIGANIILIDDIIKSAMEAHNAIIKDGHWNWFTNTIMQRTEGDWKIILIMTRWATDDLAGRIMEEYGDLVEGISYAAVQPDGSMLDDSVLDKEGFRIKTLKMSDDIAQANYNQKPMDIKGRMYNDFKEWDKLPEGDVKNITDTADTGTDFLCSINYVEFESEVYVKDLVFTDDDMSVSEPLVADMLFADDVVEADIESNNGGRGFARNIERLLMERHQSNKCVFNTPSQNANKEARILSSSSWVQKHVYLPPRFASKYPQAYAQLMAYQRKGKNKHDDIQDVLASIYEKVANFQKVEYVAPIM